MYKNIIIPVDLSEESSWKYLLPVALSFVSAFKSKLHFVNIIPDLGISIIEDYLPHHWVSNQKEQNTQKLDDLIERYIPIEIKVTTHIGRGSVYDEVINYANSVQAELIIASAIGEDRQEYTLGHNAAKLVKFSKASVLVVRE